VGAHKVEVAARRLRAEGVLVHEHRTRLLPKNAIDLVSRYDLVLEGSDNFPTKFLVADACRLAGRPIVHGAAVRWVGTAFLVGPRGRPCYRCLFEDLLQDHVPNCAEAGVMGPVVGVTGAAQADLALAWLAAGPGARGTVEGTLVTFDGAADPPVFRRRRISARAACDLCGRTGRIHGIDLARYVGHDAEAGCDIEAEGELA
jgi:molybdopterin/thiamine biosynthesis adenylyltransferase